MTLRWIAGCLMFFIVAAPLRAEQDIDRLTKQFQTAIGQDNATGVAALFQALTEASAKADTSPQFVIRRPMEMLVNDISDAIVKYASPEAQKAIQNSLPRAAPGAAAAVCFGLRAAPANPETDTVALKMLSSGADYRVKTSVMDLMAAHKFTSAVEKIIPFLSVSEILPVQISACRALAQIPDKAAIPALLKYMQAVKAKGGGRMVYESTAALRAISGQKFIADFSTWNDWWSKNEKTFEAELSKAAPPEFNYELKDQSDLSYYEIPLFENRIIFVLDVSGSMKFGGTPNRMDKAKTELSSIIGRLSDKQYFNILTFSMDVDRWQTAAGLVQATEKNKTAAKAFLDAQKPKTGTMTTTAMEETLRQIAAQTACETIFLVSDGMPSPWRRDIKTEQQSRQIGWMNLPLKVRINTIGIYTRGGNETVAEDTEQMKKFLQEIAARNDGVYKEVGAPAAPAK